MVVLSSLHVLFARLNLVSFESILGDEEGELALIKDLYFIDQTE